MNKQEEFDKIRPLIIKKIRKEKNNFFVHNANDDEIINIIYEAGLNKKYSLWICREYLKGNIQRFEDMPRVKQALTLFKNNLSKFSEQQKQLNKMSFQELEKLVEIYLDILTQNEFKKAKKEKIWSEIEIIYEGPEGRIYSPKTEQASIFLGHGTRWCTASVRNNLFDGYNKNGPLYVFVLNKKDDRGREIKYQLHIESEQFMNSLDESTSLHNFLHSTKIHKIFAQFFSFDDVLKFIQKKRKLICPIIRYNFYKENEQKIIIEEIIKNFGLKEIDRNQVKLTEEIYKVAVQKDGNDLWCVPDEMRTKEICEIAVRQNGEALCFVPDELKTYSLCEIAILNDSESMRFVPEKCQDIDLLLLGSKENPKYFINILKKYPKFKNFERAIEINGMNFLHLKDDNKTQYLCELAVKKNINVFEHINKKFKTKELCDFVLSKNPSMIKEVPVEFITEELCKHIVKKDGRLLNNIPKQFISHELYLIALESNPRSIEFFPREYRNYDLYKIAVKKEPYVLRGLSPEIKTKELCEIAVKEKFNSLQYVPHEYIDETLIFNGLKNLFTRKNVVIETDFEETLELIFSPGNKLNEIFVNLDYTEMSNISVSFLSNKLDEYKRRFSVS